MKLRNILIASLVGASSLTGFGALPSKPDFAFPKTVSANAEKELAVALKSQNGPAIVRQLINWGLAQTEISDDNIDKVTERLQKVEGEVKSPVTKAMIQLLRSDVTRNDSIGLDAVSRYTDQLRQTSVYDWRHVINVDDKYLPTLYDFAVAMLYEQLGLQSDSLRQAALTLNADKLYPRFYFSYMSHNDRDGLLQLYRDFVSEAISGYALQQAATISYSLEQRGQIYGLVREWLERFGSSSLAPDMRATAEYLCRPELVVNAQSVIVPGKPLSINVHSQCLNSGTVEVRMVKPTPKPVATLPVEFSGEGVFERDTTLNITLKEYGEYRIIPRFKGQTISRNQRRTGADVSVTSFLLCNTVYGRDSKVLALDALNGAEQTDVKISHAQYNRWIGRRGADIYSPELYAYGQAGEIDTVRRISANIITDRAIYHPGDTLRFAATIMSAMRLERRLETGFSALVELRNTNYEEVGKLTLVSDEYGRIHGEFPLPSSGLTGRYILRVADVATVFPMVTDYKAPTFDAEITSTRIDSTTVEFIGSAIGYNGFPIAGAQVAINVRRLPRWVWFRDFRNSGGETVATDTVTTDEEGKFSIRMTIPAEGNFVANATMTSPAGESHDAACFIASKRYFISADVPQFVEAGHGPKFRVLNSEGEVSDTVRCAVTLTSADGSHFNPDENWDNIPSGKYALSAVAEEADTFTIDSVCVYRRSDAMPPAESMLFVPVTAAKPGDKLLVGTSYDDSHILYTLWTPQRIIEQKWLEPEQGNFMLDIELPNGVDNATLTLSTLHNYRNETTSINIRRPDQRINLNLEITSMRDRMTPGETETWTIKVNDNLGKPVPAAVMIDVYSKALDALKPYNWNFYTPRVSGKFFRENYVFVNSNFYHASRDVNQPSGFKKAGATFDLYGRHWPYGYVMEYMVTNRLYGARSAAPMMKMEAAADEIEAVDACAEEEVEVKAAAGVTESDSGVAVASDDEYRMPEVPVALWAPVLTSDRDGNLQVQFTAPNANTTWSVNALAYDRSLLNGIFRGEIVTSKPVMVQPQLPRFLHVGDRIEFRAMVMNNSDTTRSITSLFEIYDPLSGDVLHTDKFLQSIEAGKSDVISTWFDAPSSSMVGVRVRATAENFTDGEQAVISILPADVTVRTGQPVFLPSDSTHAELSIPRGGVMTFTANAVWECVTALPGLQTSESKSALSLASSLFSAATARGLLRSYPAIGRAISEWQGEDSALVSRLEKNPDLKIAMLSSTPWVGTAQTIDERMARLSLLFDRKLTEKTIASAIENLSKLVCKGGLAWTSDCDEPSEWITTGVLRTIAQLRRMGYAPESKQLETIVTNAVRYLDNQVASDYAKDKDAVFPEYVFIRSQFPEVGQSGSARRAAAATVQHIVGNWRDMSVASLPMAAIILNENGYGSTSRLLLESLRQREAWRTTWLHPLMLEAFHRIEPGCDDVELIRNYFIQQKQSTSWGDGPETSNLIAAILTSGADWLVPAENALGIRVNGEEVRPNIISSLGEFRINLPEGGDVAIAKGNFPAWGGVFSSSVDSITSVEAFASPELKITRTLEGELKVGSKVTLKLTIEASQPQDFVMITQPRCAAFEPVDQLPSTLWSRMGAIYREPCSTVTNWFIYRLLKGTTEISESFYVTADGSFILAPAEAQSQMAPEFQAHSEGMSIKISE